MTSNEMPELRLHHLPARRATEILVVDPAAGEADHLLSRMPEGVEVLCLAPTGRGLEQIAGCLAGRRDVTALHVLCRGEPGALLLAGERIDLPALAMRPAVLADIAVALARDATVALCAGWVAAGPQGRQFVEYFETVLGVAVAASVGPVGSQARGGWGLGERGLGGWGSAAMASSSRGGAGSIMDKLSDRSQRQPQRWLDTPATGCRSRRPPAAAAFREAVDPAPAAPVVAFEGPTRRVPLLRPAARPLGGIL